MVTFDTLRFARNLRDKANLSPEQAEGFALAMSEALQDEIATKADTQALRGEIQQVRSELKADIQELRSELKADIQELRSELKADIQELRSELKGDIQQLRSEFLRMDTRIEAAKVETIKWVFGLIGLQTVVIVGAVIALVRLLPR
jgi:uncharacterized protein (DUF2267 family)